MTLLLGSAVALAASVTVSPGDDLNTLTASLQPGDVVTFNPGVYELDGTVYWTGVGTPEAPIQLKAAGGEVVLMNIGGYGGWVAELTDSSYVSIDGLTFAGPEFETTSTYGYGGNDVSGLYIANADHIVVQNSVFRDTSYTSLRIDGSTNNITVRHNEMTHTADGSGISAGCGDASCWMQDSVIEYNLLHDLEGNGIYLNPGCQNVLVQHNVVFRTDDTAIVLTDTAFGAQNVVSGNAVWEIEDDGIYVEGAALLQNNLVFQVDGDGIYSRLPYGSDGLYDIQISHNTVAMTDGWAARLEGWFDGENLVFANNALANPIGRGLYWEDYNFDPYGGYGYTSGTTYGESANYISHNVVTGLVDGFDPIAHPTFLLPGGGITDFSNFDNLDFYPTSASMLRDQGDPNGQAYIPQRDFNGTARDGASPDVGAYEYDGDGNPGWVVQEGFKEYTESEGRNTVGASSGCCGGADTTSTTAAGPLLVLLLGFVRRRR